MKKFFVALAAFLCVGAAPVEAPNSVRWDHAIDQSQYCETSEKYGYDVRVYGWGCPDLDVFDEQARRFLARMGAPSWALEDSVVVLVFTDLEAEPPIGRNLLGISPDKKHVVVEVDLEDPRDWAMILGHEWGHYLLRKAKFWVGDLHAGDSLLCYASPEKDICELLEAAEAWYTDELLLSEDSEYYKKFKEIK